MNDQIDPYEPPKSEVEDVSQPQPRPIFGIVIGVVVDLGGTLVGAFLFVIGATVVLAAQGLQFAEIEASVTQPEVGSLFFNVFLVIGLGFSLLGGYVCARISRVKIYRQGLI